MTVHDPAPFAKPERLMANGNVHTVDVLKSIAKLVRGVSHPIGHEDSSERRRLRLLALAAQIERLANTMDGEGVS